MHWRQRLPDSVRPYVEAAPIAAFFLGISSGFGFAMIAATLTTRLAQAHNRTTEGGGMRKVQLILVGRPG